MTNQTEGMQQRAMDFAAAAKALAEREKGRKWWEL
jgi:L-rhamnose mutarotase